MSFFDYVARHPSEGNSPPDRALFSEFADHEWRALIEQCNLIEFRTGENVIRAGEQDDAVYLLVRGAVNVIVKSAVVDVITEGSAFGEVAFFDLAPRTATIRGATDGSALVFTRGALEQLALKDPRLALQTALELGRLLAQRYRPLRARD